MVLETLALAGLLLWLLLNCDRSRAWPLEAHLPRSASPGVAVAPESVVAVVPARNEAAVLEQTLPSLLQQQGLSAVVLVDDGSTDGTADQAQRLAKSVGAGDRLWVVSAPPTPPGWAGKVHALTHGVAEALRRTAGEPNGPPVWWLFSDADIAYRAGALRSLLLQTARGDQHGSYDLVSVMARLHSESFWERMLIPPFVFFFQLLYPFRRVRRVDSRVAAAAGGCILIRRRVYEASGGHASIPGAIIDDVALARRIKAHGGRLWLGFDAEIRSLRPYCHMGEIWDMVARSAFVQLRYRLDLALLVLAGLLLLVAAPPFLLALAGTALVMGHDGAPALWRTLLWSAAAWLLQARALYPSVRHHRVPAGFSLVLPFTAILYGLMTLTSAWRHLSGRGQVWKGRVHAQPRRRQ